MRHSPPAIPIAPLQYVGAENPRIHRTLGSRGAVPSPGPSNLGPPRSEPSAPGSRSSGLYVPQPPAIPIAPLQFLTSVCVDFSGIPAFGGSLAGAAPFYAGRGVREMDRTARESTSCSRCSGLALSSGPSCLSDAASRTAAPPGGEEPCCRVARARFRPPYPAAVVGPAE